MMRLFENLRYYSFWIIDFLKGSKVRSHFKDVKFIIENYHDAESKTRRAQHLKNILTHVVKHTPYYNRYSNFKSILDFPVVNKLLISTFKDQFISKNYKQKKSFKVRTSGSTGIPFLVLQNKNKKLRNTADTVYFSSKSGYRIGHQLFYIRAWNTLFIKSKLMSFLQNVIIINVKKINSNTIPEILKKIECSNSNKAFIGYPSAFRELCNYLKSVNAKPLKSKISSVITNAETLSPQTRNDIKKYFGVVPLSRYSNWENGILSQQIKDGGRNFHINWASYYIEVLDLEKDIQADYGKLGRVVVTDLFNYHMPLIRYDTGDLAVMDIDEHRFNGAPSFLKIEGRRLDAIYNTKGELITSVIYELDRFTEIKQFQFIQEEKKKYRIKINIESVFKRENEMIETLKSFLGNDAEITVEYVNETPQLSSGKRRLTVNKCKFY